MRVHVLKVALAAGLALGLAATGAESAVAASRATCRGRPAAQTAAVKVIVRVDTQTGGDPVKVYIACARPNGRPVVIGRDGGGSIDYYGPHWTLSAPLIAGRFVGVEQITGIDDATACDKYQQAPNCSADYALRIINIVTARSRVVRIDDRSRLLAVSTTGTCGWLGSGSTLWAAAFRGPTRLVDAGAVDAKSVRLVGSTLTWRDARGQLRTVTVA